MKRIVQKPCYLSRFLWLDVLLWIGIAWLAFERANLNGLLNPPVSWDHTAHVARIALVEQNLFKHWSIHGWTHMWYAGMPVGYFYGISVDLLAILLRALSFHTLTVSETYSLMFHLFVLLRCAIVFLLARTVCNKWAGYLAVLFMIADRGSPRAGGWLYSLYGGVWVQEFAFVFIALLFFALLRHAQEPSGRWQAAIAGLVALTLITHPLNVIVLPVFLLCYGIAFSGSNRFSFRSVLDVAFSVLLGGAVAAFSLIPFYMNRYYAHGFRIDSDAVSPDGWSLTEMSALLAEGQWLPGNWAVPQLMTWVGMGIYWFTGQWKHRFLILFAVSLVFLCSNYIVTHLGIDTYLSLFTKILVRRYAIYLKYVYWAFAAAAIVWIIRQIRLRVKAPVLHPRSVPAYLVLVLLLLPFIQVSAVYLHTQYLQPPDQVLPLRSERGGLYRTRQAMLAWIKEQEQPFAPAEGSFYRIAVGPDRSHRLLDLSLDSPAPVFNLTSTPAANFRYSLHDNLNDQLFSVLGIRYFVTETGDGADALPLIYRKNFGRLQVYEYPKWDGDFFSITEGAGKLELTELSDTVVRFRAAPGSQGKVLLGISYFPNWRAWHNGEPLEIDTHTLGKTLVTESAFIELPLKPGEYTLKFQYGAVEIVSYLLSLFGVCGIALLLVRDYRTLRSRSESSPTN